jgi:hypothetical protein
MYGEDLQVVELVVRHPVEGFLGCHELAVGGLVEAQRGHGDGAQGRGDEILPLSRAYTTLRILNLKNRSQVLNQ